eukprot:TRINITY_DN4981_c0_g1_i1.p1 TRINITY_DN4981_c0_g1~~TRINITY_DN4981_c0_g1_i1.p1  ORF type:complete len:2111 (-),score=615.75 TRINITY_DN4981_c0_g1_i1:53-6385(-)
MEKTTTFPSGGKVELLKSVENLPYRKRIATAAKLGRDHKKDPQLKTLINDLRKHPAPPAVEREVEEGFSNMLSSQQRDVAKYYNEDQMALNAAAASHEHLDVLKDELKSQSVSFKKLVIKEIVRQDKSDDFIKAEILTAPRAVRKQLIGKCIKFRRVALLESLVPEILKLHGADEVASFLHGCSDKVVKAHLTQGDFIHNKNLNWAHLARYHGDLIVSMMETELSTSSMWNRAGVYENWEDLLTTKGMRELMFNSKQSLALMKLMSKYTPAEFEAYSSHQSRPEALEAQLKLPAQCLTYSVPRFVKTYLSHFLNHKRTLVPLIDFLIERIDTSRTYLRVCLPSGIWYKHVAADQVLRFVKAVFAKSTPSSRTISYSYDVTLLRDLQQFSLRHFSMTQLLDFAKVLHSVYDKIQIDNQDARTNIFQALNMFYGELTKRFKRAMKTGLKNDEEANLNVIIKSFNDINDLLMPVTIPRIEAKAVDQTLLSELTGLFNTCPPVPELLASLFERIGKLFATAKAYPSTPARLDAFISGSRELAEMRYNKALEDLLKHLITIHQKAFKNERLDGKQRAIALQQQGDLFKAMWHIFTRDPVESMKRIAKFFPYMSVELRESLWREHLAAPEDRLKILAGEHFEQMMRMFNLMPIKNVQPTVKALLSDEDAMTKLARDKLLAYQDIEDHEVRKQMQKAADSKNPTERLAAMKRLTVATILSKSAVQAGRTLKYIRDKIKNEAIDRRNEVLNCLVYFEGPKEAHEAVLQREKKEVYANSFLREDTPEEQFEMWLKLLQDVLEAPDLNRVNTDDYSAIESHASFKHFWHLSKCAIARGSEFPLTEQGNALSTRFLAFAFEIQWRIGLYIRGDRKAVEKFKLATQFVSPTTSVAYAAVRVGGKFKPPGVSHDPFKRRPAYAKRFVETIVNLALPKFRERFPRMKVHDLGNFFAPLFQAANAYWKDLPVLTSYLNDALDNLKKTSKKDEEGLLVIEHDNPIFKVFEPLLTFKRQEHWSKIPALNDYVETILHSRQAPTVIKPWMYHHEVALTKNGTKAQRAQKRDETVTKLLSISKSALHLKFVWHHLFENRQDLLDKYINEADPKSYRGVFYVNPDDRPLYKKVEVQKVVVQAKVVRRARGVATPAPVVVKGTVMLKAVHNVREIIAKQNDAEDKIKDEMSLNGDHRDFYTFEGCYKLNRLLPRQSLTLAGQWLRHLLNGDRPMPERIKAAIRWTLLPTTAYYDVVKFLNEYEKEDEKTKRQALPINLIEPVLRGAMHNDEPSAALRWLLSPEFLGSERARVAIYAVAQCVPHLPDDGLTKICRTILTGKNRHQLKVTAYKEIIRLLTSSPTTENIEMVLHEWSRKELHRDVAITIIQCAFAFLKSPEESKNALGWKIIELTFEKYPSHSEILTTLLATKTTNAEQHLNVLPEYNGQEMQQPRVKELMDDLAKREIPKKHVVDYINKVVKRLVNLETLDEDDDVKHLARVSMFYWREHEGKEGVEYFVKYALKFLSNFNSKLLRSTKVGDQKVFFARSTTMWNFLANCCGINTASSIYVRGKGNVHRTLGDRESFAKAIENYTAEIGRLSKSKCTAEESRVRVILLNVFDAVLTDGKIWPATAIQSNFYDRETELKLIAPIQKLGNMYWLETTKRILNSLRDQPYTTVVGPIREAFTFALSHQTFISDIITAITSYVSSSYHSWQYTESDNLHQVLLEVFKPLFVDSIQLGPEAAALLTMLRVKMLVYAPKFAEVGEHLTVANLIYDGIVELARVQSVLPPDFDLFSDMLNLFTNVCITMSPNVWSGTRVFTQETKQFVSTVIDRCLSAPPSGREGELAREFVTRAMTQHPEDLALTYSSVEDHNKLMYAVLLHAASSDLSTSVLDSVSKCIVNLVSDIHFYVDQVFNKSTRARTNNDLNESPATIAALNAFFSRSFISTKTDEITALKINDAIQHFINTTGVALLNEFPSYLWVNSNVAFAFIRSALSFNQKRASTKQFTSKLAAVFNRAMTLSWNTKETADVDDDEEEEKPKDKKKEKHYDLTVTIDLVRRLMQETENTHLARSIALQMVTSASWETAVGDDKVSRPELVALLEEFYTDDDETLRVKALKVQTAGKRFK